MARHFCRGRHVLQHATPASASGPRAVVLEKLQEAKTFQRGKQKEAREEYREIVKGSEELWMEHQHLIQAPSPTLWVKIDFLSRVHCSLAGGAYPHIWESPAKDM